MSQVIQKFEPGGKTTQPRLYKRGNEDINLDSFSNIATTELQRRLSRAKLSDEEKQAVQDDFIKILQGMYDGTFTYRTVGGGFDNTVGMTNDSKSAMYAAGILGDVLRSQSAYVAPEENTPEPTWNGRSTIGKAVLKKIFGNDTANVRDFIGLDWDPTTRQVTNNTNRSRELSNALTYIKNNIDSQSVPESERASLLEDIDLALRALGDNNLTENEYLLLGRATGIPNIRDFFVSSHNTPARVYTNEEEWLNTTHPRNNNNNLDWSRSLFSNTNYYAEDRNKLTNALNTLSNQALLKFVYKGIATTGNLNQSRTLVRAFGGVPNFENNYILKEVLEILRRRGDGLYQFGDNSNQYYIPFNSNQLNTSNRGIVYQISPTGDHKIIVMDRHDIPYFRNLWHQEFLNQVPSHKNGGILKFQTGGTTPWYAGLTDYDSNLYTHAYNLENLINGDITNSNSSPWASATVGQQLGRYTPTTGYGQLGENNAHYNYAHRVEDSQYYKDFGQALLNADGTPTEVGTAWMKKVDSLLPENSPARFYDAQGNLRTSWSPNGNDAHGRPQRAFTSLAAYINSIRNDQILGARHNVFLNEGKRYFYKDANGIEHWVNPEDISKYNVSENPVRSQWDNNVYWSDYELTGLKEQEPSENATQNGSRTPTAEEIRSWIRELALQQKQDNQNPGKWSRAIHEMYPDLLGAGRLWASLYTNNKVYNKILPSLKPVLRNTPERYSPITGDFAALQLKNRQGAETLSQSYRPFTSDADLAAARMLEGQQQATKLQTEGFLADNQEIRRTRAEALNRQEDNAAKRMETANVNAASINKTWRERAQLAATLFKSNWQSLDNFLAGLETRKRARLDEDRERANNFYDKIDAQNALNLYATYQEQAQEAYLSWKSQPGNSNKDITEWPEYFLYKSKVKEAKRRADDVMNANLANRYNFAYNRNYPEEETELFFDRGWNGRFLI